MRMQNDVGLRAQSPHRSPFSEFWFPLLVLVLSLIYTVLLWLIIVQGINDRAENLFHSQTEQVASRIVQRIHDCEQVLLGANALFQMKGDAVTRSDWHRYISALKLRENNPGILGVGYAVWLPPTRMETHLKGVRAEGFPEYTIRPEGRRSVYAPVIWIEPFDEINQRAFGLDMYSEPSRRAVMDAARDTGRASIATRVALVQETGKNRQSSLLIYIPNYQQELPTDTVEQRRAALHGFVYGTLRTNDLVSTMLSKLPSGLDLEIYVGETPTEDNLIYSSRLAEQRTAPTGYRPLFSSAKTIEAYGSTWYFKLTSLPEFDMQLSQRKSLTILLAGTLLSTVLCVLAFQQARARRQAMTLADQMRTAKYEAEVAKAEAEQANQAKSSFLSTMSHEIRTPMAVFMGAIERLKRINKSPEHRPLLVLAEKSSQHLYALVNDILDFSKIEAGRMDIAKDWFNLRNYVQETVAMMAAKAQEKGLRLELAMSTAVPESIVGDQSRIGQVLINLIGNAIKFTDEGVVRVALERIGNTLEFTVSDTGIGISEDKMEKIFARFTQVDSSSSRRHSGTGLGLAISKGLAELMGGRISVESQLGQGSVFTFTLPMESLPSLGSAQLDEDKVAVVKMARGTHILLAEDNPLVREMILITLSGLPCQAATAETGKDAVRKWQTGNFDLILMDLQMPEVDGLEATREIRRLEASKGKRVGIIGLTAYADRAVHQECFEAGMDDVLVKPFEDNSLYKAIERCLAS